MLANSFVALSAAALATLVPSVHAFFRMPCSQPVVVERSDPRMKMPDARSAPLARRATQDRSNYWTPTLFYQAQNGSFHRVEQNGGMTVYYLQRTGSDKKPVQAFPAGFRMLAGDPFLRSYDPTSLSQKAVSHVCLNYKGDSPETPMIPNRNCPDGLRTQLFFPSCWDGVNLDSKDHKSHMAYPSGMNSGDCPATHPVRLVSIFYEIIWNVNDWKNMWWKPDGSHPFVLSMGDPTGYGFHGDFLNGWDIAALQRALDKCTQDSGRIEDCAGDLELQDDSLMKDCINPTRVAENTLGWLPALPGCNPVTYGPGRASPQACPTVPSILSLDQVGFEKKDVPFWDPVGCAKDDLNNRLLPRKFSDPAMTIEMCGNLCHNNGYTYAGAQWGVECWCGSSFDESRANLRGSCSQPCAGDRTEICGNGGMLSVYKYNPNKNTTPSSSSSTRVSSSSTRASSSSATVPAATSTPPTASVSAPEGTNPVSSSSSTSSTASSSSSSSVATSSSSSSVQSSSSSTQSSSSSAPSSTPTGSVPDPRSHGAPQGWFYRGCYFDQVWPYRTLDGAGQWNSDKMTPALCTERCASKGFFMAATEYGGECYCGNSMRGGAILKKDEECNFKCKGDANLMCGGAARMSVYARDMRRIRRDGLMEDVEIVAREEVEVVEREVKDEVVKRNISSAKRSNVHRRRHLLHGRQRASLDVEAN
ncbi:SubName: Full=Related to glyoxal oxidase {ECO:0000313/EMBL:CCA74889.1} [Serendipita indica DSM 11827]|nr:SubName: Full=Related to glyoxal oxidase {ECO:0000313/EMBL:CCA74889.1} [Serendipita indica DSM 11827]